MKTVIQYIVNNWNKYLKQNTENSIQVFSSNFYRGLKYSNLDCDSTILEKKQQSKLVMESFMLLWKCVL